MLRPKVIAFIFIFLISSFAYAVDKKEKQPRRPVLGWSEKVMLHPGELALHARLDSSRAGSTLHVKNIKKIFKNKNTYVRFSVKDRYGNEDTLERKVLRSTTIRTASGSKYDQYVVELGICLGGDYSEDEMALSDRTNTLYDVRLGHQSLEGHFVIDPALSYTTKPDCKVESKK